MNLEYAVDRLYDVGWTPGFETELETLANGRPFPSMDAIRREFAEHGLTLVVSHNPQFNCFRATWLPQANSTEASQDYGTVIGACEREAAVYALAQFRTQRQGQGHEQQLAGAS